MALLTAKQRPNEALTLLLAQASRQLLAWRVHKLEHEEVEEVEESSGEAEEVVFFVLVYLPNFFDFRPARVVLKPARASGPFSKKMVKQGVKSSRTAIRYHVSLKRLCSVLDLVRTKKLGI